MTSTASHQRRSVSDIDLGALKDLLSIGQLRRDQLEELLDLADAIAQNQSAPNQCLDGRIVASVFEQPLLSARLSIAAAVAQLGGSCEVLHPDELQLDHAEMIQDTALMLGSFAAAVTIRTLEHDSLVRCANACDVPVVNASTNLHHPLQALADMLTIRQQFGSFDGLRVAWLGEVNNVAHSLMEACAILGVNITIATLADRGPDPKILGGACAMAEEMGSSVDVVEDPSEAARGANIVYTDVWVTEQLHRYQVDAAIMARAADNAIFMHCLPAHRGEEVTADVIDGPQSRIFRQTANRRPTAQAVLQQLVGAVDQRPLRMT